MKSQMGIKGLGEDYVCGLVAVLIMKLMHVSRLDNNMKTPEEVARKFGFEYAPMKITARKKVFLSDLHPDQDYYDRKLKSEWIGIFAFGLTVAVLLIIAFFQYVVGNA